MCYREYNWKEIENLMQNCTNVIQEGQLDINFSLLN